MIDAKNIFNPNDFKSITLEVFMKNLTTHTETNDPSLISLVEIGERTLIFEFPARSCNVKHSLFLEIRKLEPGEVKSSEICSLTGKVIEAETMSESEMRVVVEAVQVDEESWNRLEKLYSSRQEQITQFLLAVRG